MSDSTNDTAPALVTANSHSVTLGPGSQGPKEEVFLYFEASWRGHPAVVVMEASRYTASFHDHATGATTNQFTEWRVFAREARAGTLETNAAGEKISYAAGDHLTDTARRRLGDLCGRLVESWLESEAYKVSESAAYWRAIRNTLYAVAPYKWATTDFRRALAAFAAKLTPAQIRHLEVTADAFDAFVTAYNTQP